MFECEYPDHKKFTNKRIFDGKPPPYKLRLKIVSGLDAPDILQMNWENWVLWRTEMTYPNGYATHDSPKVGGLGFTATEGDSG